MHKPARLQRPIDLIDSALKLCKVAIVDQARASGVSGQLQPGGLAGTRATRQTFSAKANDAAKQAVTNVRRFISISL